MRLIEMLSRPQGGNLPALLAYIRKVEAINSPAELSIKFNCQLDSQLCV